MTRLWLSLRSTMNGLRKARRGGTVRKHHDLMVSLRRLSGITGPCLRRRPVSPLHRASQHLCRLSPRRRLPGVLSAGTEALQALQRPLCSVIHTFSVVTTAACTDLGTARELIAEAFGPCGGCVRTVPQMQFLMLH